MEKPDSDDSQLFDRTSSPTSILPPADLEMNWPTTLSQSDPSIISPQNHVVNRSATTVYNSSSYKVSIGHETVNITEMTRPHEPSSDPPITVMSNERRRVNATRRGVNILSLCFMCFVSTSLILTAISVMHLLSRTNSVTNTDMLPFLLQSSNFTPGFLYVFAASTSSADTISNLIVPIYDRTIRDLATIVCLLIIVLNCFSLLVFSIEIYLGSNMIKTKSNSPRSISFAFSSSTARFIAICCFYASIPALILVMCLFILLNMSVIPAIISLLVLGLGLIFILITLLTYFSSWQNQDISAASDDDIDLTKADELSTLV